MIEGEEYEELVAHLAVESPYGETPGQDVACADCGAYRTLHGPLDFEGKRVRHGDFVCRQCVRSRCS